ncbi:MAG: hypothetical protein E7425_09570 [Ruminococcaceae bacterium]|nr:hypothetical protein [Oscillospiraceae bacterium]
MTMISFYVFLLLAVGVLIVIVGVVAYNKRLDRITNGELHDTHSAIPEPRTTVGVVYRTTLIAVAVISLLSVSAMNGMLSSMQSAIGNLQNRQNQLYSEVLTLRHELEDRDRTIANAYYEITDVDYEDRTAEVLYTVELRRYTDAAAVALRLNGESMPLARSAAGVYSTRFTAGLFEDYLDAAVCVTENGVTVTETADFPQNFFWDYLPIPSLSCSFSSRDAFGKLTCDGRYTVLVERPDELVSATVTYLTSGRAIKTLDILRETQNGEEIVLEKGLKLDKDLTFRFEYVTKDGFTIEHQSVMCYHTAADLEGMEFTRIYDAEGRLLWEDRFAE